jgi:hypothetical protein
MKRHFDQGLGMHPRNYGLVLNLADLCGTSRTLHTFALCSEKLRGSKITGPHTVQAIFFGTQILEHSNQKRSIRHFFIS